MPARQTVTGTFQTTDAESATAEGEIKLIYAGTDSLQPKDFTLSSEEDGMEYGEVTISGVEKTENGWGIKIRFAKSLALGSINEKQLYVHYKGSLIGSITLTKEVNLVQLAAPADVKWDETVKEKPSGVRLRMRRVIKYSSIRMVHHWGWGNTWGGCSQLRFYLPDCR